MTTRNYTRKDDATRNAVLNLLRRGLASPAEASDASGISRTLISHWLKGINWKAARAKRVNEEWQKEMDRA